MTTHTLSSAADITAALSSAKRLAAVLFADAVDFTSWTARDEDQAFVILNDFLTTVAHPALDRLGAKTRKNLGDGLLATFENVETAVNCAENLQAALAADREEAEPRWKGLRFRIAINLSHVRFAGDDVFGDGVNLARRLQEAAAADSIILSHAACDIVRASRAEEVRDLGFVALKGFERPIRAYDLNTGPAVSLRLSKAQDEIPSIAVLPFESLGASVDDTYFADGLAEDIIASLSSLREMVVISRGSTLGFRDQQITPIDARRVWGVRYVLQGTIRRRSEAIRLSATLSDAETGAIMFTAQSDIEQGQLFEHQDQLVSEIVASIAPKVRKAELARAMRKPPEVFSAYDCLLKALDLMRRLEPASYDEARRFLDQAIADDPSFAAAYCWRAAWWIMMVVQGWVEDRNQAGIEAESDAKRAVELDEGNAQALAILAQTKAFLLGDHEAALNLMERARHVGPGNTFVMMISAGTLAYVGRGQEAVKYAEQAHQLVPLDQIPFREFDWIALAYYSEGQYARAAFWARRALEIEKGHLPSLRLLAASLAADGDDTGAREAADVLLSHAPDFSLAEYADAHATFADKELQTRWILHLGAAGLPG